MIIKYFKQYINRETISYLICGILTTIVALVSFVTAIRFELSITLANTVSTILAVIFAYVTNKIFVFCQKNWKLRFVISEFGKFCTARLITFVAETILLVLLVDMLNFPDVPTKMFTMILVTIGNYVLAKLVVFVSVKNNH